MSALADEAHELSDRLGDEHDVAVLRDWAHRHASALNGADPVLRGFDVIVREPAPRAPGARRSPTARGSTPTTRACSSGGSRAGGRRPSRSAPPPQRASA